MKQWSVWYVFTILFQFSKRHQCSQDCEYAEMYLHVCYKALVLKTNSKHYQGTSVTAMVWRTAVLNDEMTRHVLNDEMTRQSLIFFFY